jgi:pteridine reductase
VDLKDKVAIVTGAAVRLGQALALALAEQEVRVAVHYSASAVSARNVVDRITSAGHEALVVQEDFSRPGHYAEVIDRVADHFGRMDILVNSAAIFESGTLASTTEENWDKHLTINLKAPFFLSQAFARKIEQRGHIINIADWRATRPDINHIAYSIAKAGLVSMTQTLALALAPNIQVNAIAPGAILPPPGKGQEYLQSLAQTIPAQRVGSLDEITNALLFLLHSDFVTGDLIFVTGGQHL